MYTLSFGWFSSWIDTHTLEKQSTAQNMQDQHKDKETDF